MAIAELQKWIGSREKSYDAGLKLFEKYGNDDFLLEMLRLGETGYNRQELLRLLIEVSKQQAPVFEVRKKIATPQEYVRLPAEAQLLVNRAEDLKRLNGNRVGELQGIIDRALRIQDPVEQEKFLKENETGDKANIILDTDDELQELFDQIDFAKQNGRLPDPPPPSQLPEDMTYIELKQLQANLRSQKSKCKSNPEKHKQICEKLSDVDRRLNDFV